MILSALEKGTHPFIPVARAAGLLSLTGIDDFVIESKCGRLKGPFISFSVFSLLIPGTRLPVIPGLDKPPGAERPVAGPLHFLRYEGVRLISPPHHVLVLGFPGEKFALWGEKGSGRRKGVVFTEHLPVVS